MAIARKYPSKRCPVCSQKFNSPQGMGGHLSGPCGFELKKARAQMAHKVDIGPFQAKGQDVCVPVPPMTMGTILEEAQKLVYGDRNRDYGHPLDDFSRTGQMATGLLAHKLRPGEKITAEDVGLFMILVKLSRQVNRPKRDNMTDTAGYAATVQMCVEERRRREHNNEGDVPSPDGNAPSNIPVGA